MRPLWRCEKRQDPLPEFKNPNAGSPGGAGNQDNRSFLVIMLVTLGVLFGLQYWRTQHNPQTAPPSSPAALAAPSPSSTASTAAPAAQVVASGAAASTPAVQAGAESSILVENEVYRITFSNRGAQATSWVLKRFKDTDGRPLDLVHYGAAAQFGFPLSLYTYDQALTQKLAQALYVPSATGTLTAPATLSFEYAAGDTVVHKTFRFGDDFVVHADTQVLRNGAPVRALLAWPAALGDMENAQAYAGAQIDTLQNGKDDHLAFKKVSGGGTLNGPFSFAGLSDGYFAAVFLPDQPATATVATLHNEIDVNKVQRRNGVGQGAPAKGSALVPVLGAALGDASGHTQTRLFVGPKSTDVLKAVKTADGETLSPLLDFGFWGPIGKYLFVGLQTVHHLIAPVVTSARDYSWGWAIILFTILINLVLLPLRLKGMQSALKMQRIQPQLDQIKARFGNPKATDPKMGEMNAEIMAFQKKEGVSMLGGCVPTLIQLPLLFAFFTMMTRVVELRQAHWFWLPDLSSADPYHVLPILMVVTSFLVQFYTPSPGVDPQQAKMMAYMMPAFSGYMTWNYASGLALYWNVGNLIMIVQQLVMNRTALGREIRELQAKRAAAKAQGSRTGTSGARGAGKVIQGRR